MSDEPVRWSDADDAPPGIRRLLAAGRAVGSMPPDVHAALLAELPAAPPPGTGSPPPRTGPGVAGLPAGTAIAAGALAVAAIVAGAVAWSRPATAPPPRPPTATATAEPFAPAPAPAPAEQAASEASASGEPRAPARPSRIAPAREPSLAEESALIGRARATLRSDPSSSLGAIDEHARRFPRGELAPEREYLRVKALHGLGRDDEARTRARSYLATYSSSPHVAAVRALLAELEPR